MVENKNRLINSIDLEIKQENSDTIKSEFDSCSQDSSNSGYQQRWAPNLDGVRKSAFMPYKPACTALTNLQRGNTQARVAEDTLCEASPHWLAGRGEAVLWSVTRGDRPEQIDARDEHGLTPLMWAASYGQIAATSHLLWCGADPNFRGPMGETALLLAAAGGHQDVVRILLTENAHVNHQDDDGNTALIYAASGNHPYSCQELLLRGADVTLTNEWNDDAYGLAVRNSSALAQAVIERFLVSNLLKNAYK